MHNIRIIILALLVAVFAVPAGSQAQNEMEQPDKVIRVISGKSVVIDTVAPVSRVSLARPETAGLVLLSPRQIYITGQEFGTTTLTLWRGSKVLDVYDVQVIPDVVNLKRMLHELLPSETRIKVLANAEHITLAGSVTNAASLTAAVNLAETVAPEKVVNLLRMDGVQQVMLEVRVAEMGRDLIKRMGVNFQAAVGQFSFYSFLNNLSWIDTEKGTMITDRIQASMFSSGSSGNYSMFLDALKAHGLVRILAEPNLVCVSGESAKFLAGGEIPIPVPGSLGTVAIEFKPFGVGLQFTPTVMNSKLINLKVAPEVSDLDYSRSISLDGYEVPAISTRRASTVIELADGQSFAIAGLINETLRENNYRFPVLGDIPVLGSLFRSSEYQKGKTELVILVTAHLVKPLDAAEQVLPTDNFREPDDYEFYMLGLLEGRSPTARAGRSQGPRPGTASASQSVISPESGFDGDMGHALPQ